MYGDLLVVRSLKVQGEAARERNWADSGNAVGSPARRFPRSGDNVPQFAQYRSSSIGSPHCSHRLHSSNISIVNIAG